MGKTNLDEVKLGGAKRKNGHKSTCACHICENMKNKAKRGGYSEEMEKKAEYISGGSKKKNGHRKNCKCPICKNMNNSKKHKKGGKRKTRKIKGGDDSDGYEEEKEKDSEEEKEEEMTPYDDETDSDEETEDKEETNDDESESDEEETKTEEKKGGKKKGNGHKSNCKCPICKNMHKKGGEEPTSEETKASDEDYEQLEAIQNASGGTRKNKKKRGKKWGGKTKRRHS